MGRKMIGLGAPTSTGGQVLEGNSGINIDNSPSVASVGHMASCPACAGQGAITAVGPRTFFLPAGPVALEGDYVACGCPPMSNVLIAGQSSVWAGAEHSHANITPITGLLDRQKVIKDISFSYGPDYVTVNEISRFYVDLNIHVHTSGYPVGEVISVNIDDGAQSPVSATVGHNGVAVITNAFANYRMNMEGEM